MTKVPLPNRRGPQSKRDRSILARNIASARKAAGLTQAGLAALLGASQSTVASWERSQNEPSFTTLQRIADALQISVDKLLAAETPFSKELVRDLDLLIPKIQSGEASDEEVAVAMRKAEVITKLKELFLELGFDDVFMKFKNTGVLVTARHRLYLAQIENTYRQYESALPDERDAVLASALEDARQRLTALRTQIAQTLKIV